MQNLLNKLEKIIQSYIPKNTRCRPDEQKNEVKREQEKQHIMKQIEKVENPNEVELTTEWTPINPDMSVCVICKEVAYTGPRKLSIKINGKEIYTRRPVVLCEPCLNKAT